MQATQTPKMGDNRTGCARAPERCEDMLSGNEEFAPAPNLDGDPIAQLRIEYAAEAEPLGSLPPPASMKQVGKTVMGKVKGGSPSVFIDKLGARLAFERAGTRLYQALISKYDAFGSFDGGPTRTELEAIMAQEHAHFTMLKQAMEELGGDPTAMTPSADIEDTASNGVRALLVDPRVNLAQSLEAILVAELVDNDCWDGLVDLATKAGEDELATRFAGAREEEREHLVKVRAWLAAFRAAA
jgi:rubrerythrin